MNVQKLFEAVKSQPDQSTLIVVATELERQRYAVTVNHEYHSVKELVQAEERGKLDALPIGIGVPIRIKRGTEEESFRLHFLDVDAIAITDVESPPITYNPDFTISEFR